MTANTTNSAIYHARLVRFGAGAFVGGLLVLHVLQPELDPRWRYPSEYALGEHGWVMAVAFAGLGVAFLGAARAVGRLGSGRRLTKRLAQTLLVVSGLGPLVAAAFETDPITAPSDSATTTGTLHQVGASLSAAIPFAVLLVLLVLRRHHSWKSIRLPVLTSSVVALASSLGAAAVVAAYADAPHDPGRLDGLALRLELACTSAWLLILAWALTQLARLRETQPHAHRAPVR